MNFDIVAVGFVTTALMDSLSGSTLRADRANARTHTRHQIRQISESIRAFGFTNPILINHDNMVIAGHGRVEAAKLLGMEDAIDGDIDVTITGFEMAEIDLIPKGATGDENERGRNRNGQRMTVERSLSLLAINPVSVLSRFLGAYAEPI